MPEIIVRVIGAGFSGVTGSPVINYTAQRGSQSVAQELEFEYMPQSGQTAEDLNSALIQEATGAVNGTSGDSVTLLGGFTVII